MLARYREVVETVLRFRESKERLIRRAVISLLPRLAAFAPERFAATYLKQCTNYLLSVLKFPSERGVGGSLHHMPLLKAVPAGYCTLGLQICPLACSCVDRNVFEILKSWQEGLCLYLSLYLCASACICCDTAIISCPGLTTCAVLCCAVLCCAVLCCAVLSNQHLFVNACVSFTSVSCPQASQLLVRWQWH